MQNFWEFQQIKINESNEELDLRNAVKNLTALFSENMPHFV